MNNLKKAREDARIKALDSLSRYKFIMFGYHAAIWVKLNNLCTKREPNPFAAIVELAKQINTE